MLPAVPRVAVAQTYPSRPVRIIVPVPPGGALDILARLIGQWLSERLGQPFVIENRAGGGTNIGIEAVVRASADGYTLLLIPGSVPVNVTLQRKLNFNFMRDIVPIAMISRIPLVMTVALSVPAKTVPEFIAYAKANPGKISMASGGLGSTSHVGGELFKLSTGVDMLIVPYRGGAPALTDLIGGQVQVYFSYLPESIEFDTKRHGTRARGDHRDTFAGAAGFANRRRFRAGLRGKLVAGYRRAQKYARRNRRYAQQGS